MRAPRDLRAGFDPMPAEVVQDRRQALAVLGVFGVFGGFWLLAGLAMRRPTSPRQA